MRSGSREEETEQQLCVSDQGCYFEALPGDPRRSLCGRAEPHARQHRTNSPGHRPTACQNPGNIPPFLRTVPFGYWTPVLESSRIPFMVSWATCLGRRCVPSNPGIMFLAVQKSTTKSVTFFIDFGSQNRPQIHPEITKNPFPNPSRNRTRKITEHLQKQTQPNLVNRAGVQAWCYFSQNRGFRKVTKIIKKTCKNSSQNHQKSVKKASRKAIKKNMKNKMLFFKKGSRNGAKRRPIVWWNDRFLAPWTPQGTEHVERRS